MNIKFDILNRYKFPQIKLCLPNRKGQHYISNYRELKVTLKFNSLNEISFKIDKYIYNTMSYDKKVNESYDSIKGDKLLYLGNDFGWYIITEANIQNDGISEYKEVSAIAYEYLIARSEFYGLQDTVRLYNPMDATDKTTIVGMFLRDNPLWSLGTVSTDLFDTYRTFDISSSNWYEFLMENIEETYSCIIIFDNINRLINFYTPEESIKNTNVYISYDNLINKLQIEENADEIYNAMDCFGGEDLTINNVNPMGTSTIYNFGWLIQNADDWMSSELKNAIIAWQTKYNNSQTNYSTLMVEYRTLINNLVTAQTELKELQTVLKSKQEALALYIGTDNITETRYSELSSEVTTAQNNVDNKQTEIDTINGQITAKKAEIEIIVQSLQFSNTDNFTNEQYIELQSLIKKTSYQNETFTVNSLDSDSDIINEQQKLYDHCISVLNRISNPRYTTTCDIANFAFLPEYERITKEFGVGCQFTVEVHKNYILKFFCLSVSFEYDNPEKMTLEIGNRYKSDNSADEYSDLFNRTIKSASNFNWVKNTVLDADRTGLNNEVRNFISNNLNASQNEINTATGIKMNISGSGIQVQKFNEDDTLSGLELRILNSGIFLSEDNFNSPPKTAIGRFKLPNSENYVFGVNAELLASNLIVTEQMFITSEKGLFKLDSDGLYCKNGNIIVENNYTSTEDLYTKVEISPSNADGVFTIYGKNNEKKLYVDSSGNITITGNINALSGSIGGWTADNVSLHSGTNTTYVSLNSDVNTNYAIWAGNKDAASAPFYVTRTGKLKTTDADISGTITAVSGTIGGYTISSAGFTTGNVGIISSDIYYQQSLVTSGTSPIRIYAGNTNPVQAPFEVLNDGSTYINIARFGYMSGGAYQSSTGTIIDTTGIVVKVNEGMNVWSSKLLGSSLQFDTTYGGYIERTNHITFGALQNIYQPQITYTQNSATSCNLILSTAYGAVKIISPNMNSTINDNVIIHAGNIGNYITFQ